MNAILFGMALFAIGSGLLFTLSRRGTGKPVGPEIAAFVVILVLTLIAWVLLLSTGGAWHQ